MCTNGSKVYSRRQRDRGPGKPELLDRGPVTALDSSGPREHPSAVRRKLAILWRSRYFPKIVVKVSPVVGTGAEQGLR